MSKIGIIIDKFGSLREQENEKTKDIEGICFICGHTKFLKFYSKFRKMVNL